MICPAALSAEAQAGRSGPVRCTLPAGHPGPHGGADATWTDDAHADHGPRIWWVARGGTIQNGWADGCVTYESVEG